MHVKTRQDWKNFLAKIDKKINETWDSFGFYVFSTGKKVKKHDNSKGKIHK